MVFELSWIDWGDIEKEKEFFIDAKDCLNNDCFTFCWKGPGR